MVVGIRLEFLSAEMRAEIEEICKKSGYELRYLSEDKIELSDIEDCGILFGKIPAKMLKDVKGLKWYQTPSAGVDGLLDDSVYANPNVILTNASGAYGVTIAEHQIMMIIMLMRRQLGYFIGQNERNWVNLGNVSSIYGSTIVIVGVGNLGCEFAKRAKALGARTIGIRRTSNKSEPGFDEMYTEAELSRILPRADVVSMCLPQTESTQGMLTRERLALLKDTALIVNVGRGSAIDQEALAEALYAGKLGGAALDVTVPEPLPKEHPLWNAPNAIITPHVSGNHSLAYTREIIHTIFKENLIKFAKGETLSNVVDRKIGY